MNFLLLFYVFGVVIRLKLSYGLFINLTLEAKTEKMGKLIINSHADFEQYIGKELGVSEYHKITQEQINKFADATLDHQWIHIDEKRAKKESPYGSTIAHGYLTLSVLPYLWDQIIEVHNLKLMVNYGIEKLKFNHPVLVNNEVRITTKLSSLVNLRGISKAEIKVVMEIKDNDKPAFEGSILFLYHFI